MNTNKQENPTGLTDPYVHNAAIDLFQQGLHDAFALISDKRSLVELGPGNGHTYDLYVSKDFENISFVDIENLLDKKIAEKVSFNQCDFSSNPLPFKDNTVANITAFEVIEHVENPWNMVREVYRVLEPGGLFLISFPSSKDLKSRLKFLRKGDVLHFTDENNHITFFPAAVQRKLFKSFDVIAEFYTRMRIFGLGKIQRVLGFKAYFPNKAIFSSKTLYVMKKRG